MIDGGGGEGRIGDRIDSDEMSGKVENATHNIAWTEMGRGDGKAEAD